jgi:NADH dehydrogenase/NADH:ubiquinone oxidoreductase subunit G
MTEQTLTINQRSVEFKPGQTILEAAAAVGIRIPTLCHLRGTSPTGACRICLVEVSGARSLLAACSTPAAPRMVVQTESPRVVRARRTILELLLASGEHDCLLCPSCGDCRLQDLAFEYQVSPNRFERPSDSRPIEINPLIVRDYSRCILCGRCVQACNEVQVNRAISLRLPGIETARSSRAGDRELMDSRLRFLRRVRPGLPGRRAGG